MFETSDVMLFELSNLCCNITLEDILRPAHQLDAVDWHLYSGGFLVQQVQQSRHILHDIPKEIECSVK